ncbi:RNA methyltransferase [Ramlibacter solisilvae]|uniref:rRNA methyltransferase n=1 Tax=Ramlibacter tataouinensis TaxID=94132 RepID=A0A127JNT3_9BURK|nr:RNA methyltransferase [Ramlibacter tataouinensis]AMO21658.1 rRNA methyltransferase [Ramlibacter tataouinensis]
MSPDRPQFISSAANPLLKDLRRLAQDSTAYRKQGRIWLEGDHLCGAALARGIQPAIAVFSESAWHAQPARWSGLQARIVLLADALFASLSALDSPGHMGFVIELPAAPAVAPHAASVILDRVQDAGNVGSVLRSAAAFGFTQVLALKGTAALWSPKVLRAGMGAHFALSLVEGVELPDLERLAVPLVATSSHHGDFLHEARLPRPCAWMLGHEGQGVSPELAARAALSVRIMQPGGEESLNVAAAAAICLHASACASVG